MKILGGRTIVHAVLVIYRGVARGRGGPVATGAILGGGPEVPIGPHLGYIYAVHQCWPTRMVHGTFCMKANSDTEEILTSTSPIVESCTFQELTEMAPLHVPMF